MKHQIPINRRLFLRQSAAWAALGTGAAWLGTGCAGRGSDPAPRRPARARSRPAYEISLAQWSLHKTLFAGELDPLDFARTSRNDFGIDAIELVNQFYKEKAEDPTYLAELKRRAEGEGVQILLIMCDGEGALGDPDPGRRRQAVENHFKWADAAQFLGCHSIRVNAETRNVGGWDSQKLRAAEGLRQLSEYCVPAGLNCIVENHGGLSSHGKWLAAVMEEVNLPNCGTLPDFGNFYLGNETWYDRYDGVRELMPYAKAVSAKAHAFDTDGNCLETDYVRMMQIVLDSGYQGYVGIEYEGDTLSEADGIHATKALLERVRDLMS